MFKKNLYNRAKNIQFVCCHSDLESQSYAKVIIVYPDIFGCYREAAEAGGSRRVSILLLLSNNRIGGICYFPPSSRRAFSRDILRLLTTMKNATRGGNLIKSRLIFNCRCGCIFLLFVIDLLMLLVTQTDTGIEPQTTTTRILYVHDMKM